jgi:hypothetical protein
MLTAPPLAPRPGLAGYLGRDEFNQSAGNLHGKTAASGQTWATSGSTGDFEVDGSGLLTRAVAGANRIAILGSATPGAVVVGVDFRIGGLWNATSGRSAGVVALYEDANNYLAAIAGDHPTEDGAAIRLARVEGGSGLSLSTTTLADRESQPDTWYSIVLEVAAAGDVRLWYGLQGSPLTRRITTTLDSMFTSVPDGGFGIYDAQSAVTHTYDNFRAWPPTSDAVLFAGRSAEFRTNGMERQSSDGTGWGPTQPPYGDYPRVPCPTVNGGNDVEVLVASSRGDFDQVPDSGLDDLTATLTVEPCWLTVPGS